MLNNIYQKIIISGGLGNQMFQYALYLALKEKGKNIILDTSLFSYVEMHNGYELEKCFGIGTPDTRQIKWHLLKLRALLRFKPKYLVHNDLLHFDEEVFKTKCTYINGSWQSEKYFIPIEKQLRNHFIFKNIDTENRSIADEMQLVTSVSIHIRRGDYLGNSIYSGICTEDYYLKAIEIIKAKLLYADNIAFYVFSDDKEFSADFISRHNLTARLIGHNANENSYKDMYLMSQCKHNIIANSSFSWWGAWLNTNPEKIIIAPKRWFGIGSEDSYKDIVPENWLKT